MKNKIYAWQKNEQGFLILLVGLALLGLGTLFSSFLMPMIFAVVITCASYPLYKFVNNKIKNPNLSSGLVVFFMAFIVILPVSYLIGVGSSSAYNFYQNNQEHINNMNFQEIKNWKNLAVSYIPISEDKQAFLSKEIDKNATVLFNQIRTFIVNGSKSIIDNSLQVLYFMLFTLFSMFFFYKGGDKVVDKIKSITPLDDDFDDLIMRELYSLCGILTVSVFTVAILQGLAFGILTYFMDLNWLFIAVAISITSFIPIIGTVIVWLPLSIYLFTTGQGFEAVLVFFWGLVVTGIIIDNIIRPLITSEICGWFNESDGNGLDIKDFNPLDNTFLIILSNIGGIVTFGVVGLFLGPIIVSISIAIFDLYIERIKAAAESEDRSIKNALDNPDIDLVTMINQNTLNPKNGDKE